VVKLHQESAGPVGVGQPLLTLGDVGALEAVIDVLPGEVAAIQPGAPVQLSSGARAQPLAGRVERIEPVAFTKVSALGIEEQRVNVIVGLESKAEAATGLGDGFRVDARIVIRSQDDALLVPSAALVRDGAGWRVVCDRRRQGPRARRHARRPQRRAGVGTKRIEGGGDGVAVSRQHDRRRARREAPALRRVRYLARRGSTARHRSPSLWLLGADLDQSVRHTTDQQSQTSCPIGWNPRRHETGINAWLSTGCVGGPIFL
jgi:hypothetical protein